MEMPDKTITVGGVSFSADQVESVTIRVDGRQIVIGAKKAHKVQAGFEEQDETRA